MSTPTVKTTNLGLAVPGPQNPDVGSVAGGTSAGQLAAAISAHDALFPNPQVITAAGAVTLVAAVQAAIYLKAGSAAAVSVPAPLAGTIANGGYDGMQLDRQDPGGRCVCLCAHLPGQRVERQQTHCNLDGCRRQRHHPRPATVSGLLSPTTASLSRNSPAAKQATTGALRRSRFFQGFPYASHR